MRLPAVALSLACAAVASSQSVSSVYNRDTHDPFVLKSVSVESTVIGPIVRTSTTLDYENPYTKLTEATLNFGLPDAAALSGFAYYYGDEYVRGQLMDKAKAWFIYTAITSRNRDPGIMEQWSPTTYHCQIYPIKNGSDLRVRLYTVGFLQPSGDKMALPKPDAPIAVGYAVKNGDKGKLDWSVRTVRSKPAEKDGEDYKVPAFEKPMHVVAQRFKDGRVYVAGIMHAAGNGQKDPTFAVLRQPKVVSLDSQTIAFMGWLPHLKKIAVRHNGLRAAARPEMLRPGSDTAKLWAQQMLATGSWEHAKDVLHFSLKYGVPSNATALLAVPSSEMALFRAKEKEFQAAEAAKRRAELRAERDRRNWAGKRDQNWNSGGGGDPEIRISIPGATSVKAILPDRRVIDLTSTNGVWGGNFEIPATEPEGVYRVQIVAKLADGSSFTHEWTYNVDRTPPKGSSKFLEEAGKLYLEVRSEPGLDEVAAYAKDGTKWVLKESEPGVYRVELPAGWRQELTVVMKDRASNKGEITCSWPR